MNDLEWWRNTKPTTITLSERDMAEFMRQMANPPPFNEKLRKAMREADESIRRNQGPPGP